MTNNTVQLYNIDGLNIYDGINSYLKSKKVKSSSEATIAAYKSDILNFFSWKCERINQYDDLKYLNRNDLLLSLNELLDYQSHMLYTDLNKNNTVNRKVGTIKSLYEHLDFYIDLDVNTRKALSIVKNINNTSEEYGVASPDEVMKWCDYVLNKKATGRKRNLTKANIMKFSIQTGFRLGSILELKVNDFVPNENDNTVIVYADRVKGGKSFKGKISRNFYNELLEMYEKEGNKEKKNMFNITRKGVQDMMNDIKEHFNISDKRNIVFHSIRKSAATFVHELSGYDLTVARDFLGHSDTKVTEKYIGKRETADLGFITMSEQDNLDLYKEVEHEELLNVIGKLDMATRIKINQMLCDKN